MNEELDVEFEIISLVDDLESRINDFFKTFETRPGWAKQTVVQVLLGFPYRWTGQKIDVFKERMKQEIENFAGLVQK